MKSGDRLFIITFISSLAIMFFFIETTMSGYAISTTGLYCEQGVCRGFCQFDEECQRSEVCCTKMDFGVCDNKADCIQPYETNVLTYSKLPPVDRPIPGKRNTLSVYLTITLVILVIGGFYQHLKTKHAWKK